MIDTLKLSLTDYSVAPGADLDVQPSAFNAATGEARSNHPLWHDGSRYVTGSKAFHNGEDFNVTIKPLSPSEPQSIGCFVQFSVPKVVDGSNYHPVDYKGTTEALRAVQKYLRDVGIKTNIKTASLSRVDVFRTVEADEPYQSYQPVLSMLQGQRMSKRDYGTTFLWANTQQEICVYDKLVEMQQRKARVDGLPENSIRFEHRMLKGKKVRDTLGMRSAGDLLAGYDHVQSVYRNVMHKQIFKRSVQEIEVVTANQIVHEMELFKGRGDRYWYQNWLQAKGMISVMSNVDAVREAIKTVSDNRMMQSRAIKKLEVAQMDAAALKIVSPCDKTLGELYGELKSKVLA